MKLESPRVIVDDVRHGLSQIDPCSVQCIVTSPPYYRLRSYDTPPVVWGGRDDCEHEWRDMDGGKSRLCAKCCAWEGELGSEPSPDMYVDHLAGVFDQCKRVLRDDGLLWLNIGDTYASKPYAHLGIKRGDMIGIPYMVAFELRKRGWFLRSAPIWHKVDPQPESTDTRPHKSYEYVFMFSKNGGGNALFWTNLVDGKGTRKRPEQQYVWVDRASKYAVYASKPDYDGWKDEMVEGKHRWFSRPLWEPHEYYYDAVAVREQNSDPLLAKHGFSHNLRDVWTMTKSPNDCNHFAKFSQRLVLIPILASTSPNACPKCGAPFARHYWLESVYRSSSRVWGAYRDVSGQPDLRFARVIAHTKGFFPTCDCDGNDGSARSVVLDPFCGIGTTLAVARGCGLNAIGIEIQPEFADIAIKKLNQISLI